MATRGRRGRAAAAGVEGGALEISRFMGRALFSVDDKRVYCHCIMFPECQADVIMTALFWPIMRSDGVECSSRILVHLLSCSVTMVVQVFHVCHLDIACACACTHAFAALAQIL